MLKRTLTGIAIVIVLAAFIAGGYFVSPIFVDMLILLFLAGASFEMFKCLKGAGYDMYVAPIIIVLLLAYPAFYLMQYYVGGSFGIQGLLAVLLVSFMVCLSIFTFRPSHRQYMRRKYNIDKPAESHISVSIAINGVEVTTNEQGGRVEEQKKVENTSRDKIIKKYSHNAIDDAIANKGINNLFANVFLIVYPMVFMSVAWVLSFKYSAIFAVLYAIAVPAIGSDMFAYFVGSIVKGKKLCPSISPKKTVAGAVGGLIGGAVLSMVFWAVFEYVGSLTRVEGDALVYYVFPFVSQVNYVPFIPHTDAGWMWKSALIYLAIGLVCGAVSELGDLAASSIKRAIGIKDYGKIFPGHGGFMDRIDSVMYCLVILLIAFSCIYGH